MQPGTYDLQPANYTLPQKENKILILLPILRRITSDQSSIFPLFHDAVKTLHVRLQNSQFFFSLKISLALTVRAFFKFWPATCKLHPLGDSKLDCSRVFYQVTLATYYQVNQSRRITSYPGWLVVDYHVVELRQQILFFFGQKWRKLNRPLNEHYRSLNNHIAAFNPEFPKYNLKSIKEWRIWRRSINSSYDENGQVYQNPKSYSLNIQQFQGTWPCWAYMIGDVE